MRFFRKKADKNIKHHVIISGTGRAGTTFLVQLLTSLGLDTGFETPFSQIFLSCNAGMEQDIRNPNAPYIIKSPWLCDYIDEVLVNENIVIEHAIIPIRDVYSAAESRRNISKNSIINNINMHDIPGGIPGGLWHTENPEYQEEILKDRFYRLVYFLTLHNVPITFLSFPRFANDSTYLFAKLKPILKLKTKSVFKKKFEGISNPKLIHKFKTE